MASHEKTNTRPGWLTPGELNDTTIPEAAKFILSVCDLTSLNDDDSEESILRLCERAIRPVPGRGDMPHVAAVCVYPKFIAITKSVLELQPILIATVAGAFPSGDAPPDSKLREVEYAVKQGADEVDYVIDYGRFLEKGTGVVRREVTDAKRICGSRALKVILETGALSTEPAIRNAAEEAILGGADFIKTSTGKLSPSATIGATRIMLETIADHERATGKQTGIKPAGGIGNLKDALEYTALVHDILGIAWLSPRRFRIGASRLLDDVVTRTTGC